MSTYAIIQSGSKQYRVKNGDIIDVELLECGDSQTVEFKDVILFFDGKKAVVGTPHVKAAVQAEVINALAKGPKVVAYKYKKRKNYRRKVGHRQKYTRVKITDISAKG